MKEIKKAFLSVSDEEDSFADICVMSLRDDTGFLMFNQA